MSEKPARDWKHSLTLRKRIPSGQQYVPADEVVATVRWDEGEGTWSDQFRIMHEATDLAVREWRKSNINQSATRVSPAPTPSKEAAASSEPATPELDPSYLDRLPWTAFKPGPGEWIVRDTPGAKALSDELAKAGGPVTIEGHRYRISVGKDREFINRFPVEAAKK